MKLKRKHKKAIAIGAVIAGVVAFIVGAYVLHTMPPEISMSEPDWFEQATARDRREMIGYVLMGGGVMAVIVAFQELIRQARKLKL